MATTTADLQDMLMDLQHDLGKYIRMPLSFLPDGASDDEVRAAVRKALKETRSAAGKTRTARELWDAFASEAGAPLKTFAGFAALERAVEQALKWEAVVDAGAPVDRTRAEKDLAAVGPAIRALLQELDDAG